MIDAAKSRDALRFVASLSAGLLKIPDDLARYTDIIDVTKPDLLIETGTFHGESARWFAERIPEVVTIEADEAAFEVAQRNRHERVTYVHGDSCDPVVHEQLRRGLDGQRVMVSLDSHHSADFVAAELRAFAPYVTPGCYLVVEDGTYNLLTEDERRAAWVDGGGPYPAVQRFLTDHPEWTFDAELQNRYPATLNLGGWLRRL